MNIINFSSPVIPANPPSVTDKNGVAAMAVDSEHAAAPPNPLDALLAAVQASEANAKSESMALIPAEKASRKKKAPDAPPENTPQSKKQKNDSPLQETVDALFRSATTARSQQKLDQAFKDLTSCLNLKPEMTSAREMRAYIFRAQNKFQEALDDINKIFEHPDEVSQKMRIARADLYVYLGKPSIAIEEYTTILTSYNGDAQIYWRRALAFQGMGKYQEALQDYNKFLQFGWKDEKDDLIYKHCGECYFKLKIWDKAIHALTKYLNIVPCDVEARLLRGNIFDITAKFEDAIADYTKIIHEIWQSRDFLRITREALLRRAQAYAKLNKIDQAIADCNEVLRLDPTNIEFLQLRDSLKKT